MLKLKSAKQWKNRKIVHKAKSSRLIARSSKMVAKRKTDRTVGKG